MRNREFLYIVAIIVLIYFLQNKSCGKPEPDKPEVIHSHTEIKKEQYDSLLHVIENLHPQPVYVYDTIPFPYPYAVTDSTGYPQWYVDSLNSLLAERQYETKTGDSVVSITSSVKVFGILQSEKITWKLNLEPCIDSFDSTTITFPEITNPNRALYVMGIAGQEKTFIGGLAYRDKKQRVWIAGYDLLNEKKNLQIGIMIPIFK